MNSTNIEKAKELTQKLKRLFPEYEKLQSKTESGKLLNDGEKEKYDILQKQLIEVVNSTTKESFKFVNASTLVKVQSLVDIKNELKTVLTFQPKTTSDNLIVATSNEIKTVNVTGPNKKFKNLPDDLIGFSTQPTLQILGRNDLSFKNWKPIYDETKSTITDYTINCSFRLNRFPTRTWYRDIDSSYRTTSTRRTEIMRFQYSEKEDSDQGTVYYDSNHNFIAIGAVAPYERVSSDDLKIYKTKFHKNFNSFSIGVSFPLGESTQTIYTDYKFKLSKWYNIRIELKKIDPSNNTYEVFLYVNDILESTALYKGLLWNKKSNKYRRFNFQNSLEEKERILKDAWNFFINKQPKYLIASSPGFNHSSKAVQIQDVLRGIIGTSQMIVPYKGKFMDGSPRNDFRFNLLSKIITPPYQYNQSSSNPSLVGVSPQNSNFNSHWTKSKQKMNTGIDYGDITISLR